MHFLFFYRNHGLKIVCLARRKIAADEKNKEQNILLRRMVKVAVCEHIKYISNIGWAEVNGELEKFFRRTLSYKQIIDPYILVDNNIFKNMEIDMDEFHYMRTLRSGEIPVSVIAYGNIKL